jgi:hypothetical protein
MKRQKWLFVGLFVRLNFGENRLDITLRVGSLLKNDGNRVAAQNSRRLPNGTNCQMKQEQVRSARLM